MAEDHFAGHEVPPSYLDVSWAPAVRGGSFFRSGVVRQYSDKLMVVHPTFNWHMTVLAAGLFGLGIAGVGSYLYGVTGDIGGPFLTFFGLVLPGLAMYKHVTYGQWTDLNRGSDSVTRQAPFLAKTREDYSLSGVTGVQVLTKSAASGAILHSGQQLYELNLCLLRSERLNLMCHGDLGSIKADARRIAEFLQVPVAYDASLRPSIGSTVR